MRSQTLSRNRQYKDVYKRTIEIPQCTRIFKANWCLKFHNAHFKLPLPISAKDHAADARFGQIEGKFTNNLSALRINFVSTVYGVAHKSLCQY